MIHPLDGKQYIPVFFKKRSSGINSSDVDCSYCAFNAHNADWKMCWATDCMGDETDRQCFYIKATP